MLRLLAVLLLISAAGAAVVWDEGTSAQLRWGEALVSDNYTLILIDFSTQDSGAPKILVGLLKDNITLATRALTSGESFSLNDSIKVTAHKIIVEKIIQDSAEEEPYADLKMQFPASPEIALLLSADKEVYRGGELIRLTLRIENTGIVDAEGLKIILDSRPALILARYSRSALEAGRSWDENRRTNAIDPIKLDVKAPYLPEPIEFEVRVHAEYEDPEGDRHVAWGGTSFQVAGPLQLHKTVEESQDFGKDYYVLNSLWNCGNRTIDVTLSDRAGPDFQTNGTLLWQFNLSPGKTKTVSYKAVARMPGEGLIMPQAKASFVWGEKRYSVLSESPMVEVVGPLIEGIRRVSNALIEPGKEITISLNLTNSGNRKARVSFLERIPTGTKLISGKLSGSFMLPPKNGRNIEYSIRCANTGEYVLPSSEILYRDVWGTTLNASTPEMTFEVMVERKINTTNISNLSASQDIELNEKGRRPGENSVVYLSLVFIPIFWALFGRYL